MTPQEFVPEFGAVYVTGPGIPDNTGQLINPVYCATKKCGEDLAAVLSDLHPSVIMQSPYEIAPGSPYAITDTVAWLMFPDGTRVNAGLISQYYKIFGPVTGDRFARMDILEAQKAATSS